MNWQHLYLSFAGRTSKRDFWIGFAALFGAGIVASLIPVLGTAVAIAILYPMTALLTKRLHDFGRSGWLVAIPLVPTILASTTALLAASVIGDPATMEAGLAAAVLAAALSGLAMVISLAFLAWAGTREGDAGINAYGEPSGGAILL
jgi:uncharacterized membrane protein YhaH (DUF805 family)